MMGHTLVNLQISIALFDEIPEGKAIYIKIDGKNFFLFFYI